VNDKLSTGQKVYLGLFGFFMASLFVGAGYAEREGARTPERRRPKNYYEAKRLPIPRPEEV